MNTDLQEVVDRKLVVKTKAKNKARNMPIKIAKTTLTHRKDSSRKSCIPSPQARDTTSELSKRNQTQIKETLSDKKTGISKRNEQRANSRYSVMS